jgi:hypothetical protein
MAEYYSNRAVVTTANLWEKSTERGVLTKEVPVIRCPQRAIARCAMMCGFGAEIRRWEVEDESEAEVVA